MTACKRSCLTQLSKPQQLHRSQLFYETPIFSSEFYLEILFFFGILRVVNYGPYVNEI